MSLNSAMQIASSGLSAYQTAINVTSENISNVNTPGYNTQTAVLESAPQSASSGGLFTGSGVNVVSIQNSYDAALQQEIVNSNTSLGYDTTQSTALQTIQPTFNEVTANGLGAAIDSFFNSWQALTSDPTDTSERQAVLSSAQTLVDNFNNVSNNLSSAIATQNTSLVSLTAGINQNLTNIAQLNGQIQVIGASGGNTNELKDQLNQNIQNLAKQVGITYTQNSDGTTNVNYADGGGTLALVTGSQAGSFSLTPVPPSSSNYTVNLTTAGSTTGPAAVSPASGTLGATLNLIDTVIPGYQSQVNALATNIATQVNNLQTSGVDQNGNTGANVLPLFSFNPATSGATIAVTSNFGPSNIAAEGIGPGPSFTPLGTGDSSNALAIADLANSSTMPGGQTFSDFYNSLVTQVGQDVQTSGNNVTQAQTYGNQLSTLQQSNSGVSLDQELINLTTYQKSYQASATLVSTVTSMMDAILNLIGVPT